MIFDADLKYGYYHALMMCYGGMFYIPQRAS